MNVAVAVLLTLGVAAVAVSSIGVVALDDAFDRLHLTGPAVTLGVVLLGAATIAADPASARTPKVVVLVVVLLASGPVLSHATARAVRTRRFGELSIAPEELADPDARQRREPT